MNSPDFSLHRRMAELDHKGEAYWLEKILLSVGSGIARADVVRHGEGWIAILTTDEDGERPEEVFINTAHIVTCRLMEG